VIQTRAVPFTVRSIVTSSDIDFNVQELGFGYCTLYESVRHTVTLTNKSVLPQPFGFCGVPDVSIVGFDCVTFLCVIMSERDMLLANTYVTNIDKQSCKYCMALLFFT
jgi:hypothetical protein